MSYRTVMAGLAVLIRGSHAYPRPLRAAAGPAAGAPEDSTQQAVFARVGPGSAPSTGVPIEEAPIAARLIAVGAYRGAYVARGVGAAAVGAAAIGAASYPYYNNAQCGYYPYPPC